MSGSILPPLGAGLGTSVEFEASSKSVETASDGTGAMSFSGSGDWSRIIRSNRMIPRFHCGTIKERQREIRREKRKGNKKGKKEREKRIGMYFPSLPSL